MNHDSQEFARLRRLLALKRHEQPPPGYFDRFSTQVIARIKAGEIGEPESVVSRFLGGSLWWQWLSAALEAKPAFVGAFGAAVCGLLVAGIVYSESSPVPPESGLMAGDRSPLVSPSLAMGDAVQSSQIIFSSTNPVAPVSSSLFDQISLVPLEAQPAGFVVPATPF